MLKSSRNILFVSIIVNYKKLLKEFKRIAYGERRMDLKVEISNDYFLLQNIRFDFLNSLQVLFQFKN